MTDAFGDRRNHKENPVSQPIDTNELTDAVNAYNEQVRAVGELRRTWSDAAEAANRAEADLEEAEADLRSMAEEVVDHCRGAVDIWERNAA